MSTAALAAKAAVAVVLLVAGGAKLADLDGFAATIRYFLPARLFLPARPRHLVLAGLPVIAAVIAIAELLTGAVSLCWPRLGWVNLAVLALACGFTAVAAFGYARRRGQPCRCFGALTRRGFGPRALVQALLMTGAAWLATRPAGQAEVQIGLSAHLLLLAAAAIMAVAARTAAGALAAGRAGPGTAG
ncbi:MAG TPA: MauE/DoxX family redox-associated membrane protein [Streptosporangiaceae bacterium]|nr:MauE/DoxX family redox-associated membrane protein [Streptosporangiaceae bacterium]